VSFIALFGFLAQFVSGWKIVWEIFFLAIGLILIRKVKRVNLFMLSVFYAVNLVMLIALKLVTAVQNTGLIFFILSLVLMSFGIVISIASMGKRSDEENINYKILKEKSIDEISNDVDNAFDNIESSNVEVEKYYENGKEPVKKVAKKKPVKRSSKKKK
jgi:DNA integrity scanning protein DisA with diadenylate cyclase activity